MIGMTVPLHRKKEKSLLLTRTTEITNSEKEKITSYCSASRNENKKDNPKSFKKLRSKKGEMIETTRIIVALIIVALIYTACVIVSVIYALVVHVQSAKLPRGVIFFDIRSDMFGFEKIDFDKHPTKFFKLSVKKDRGKAVIPYLGQIQFNIAVIFRNRCHFFSFELGCLRRNIDCYYSHE
jgi:hypothetical protein